MTTILCYGDSNTFGFDPATSQRFARIVRWPGVLAAELGPDVHVIEEGLNDRTTLVDDVIYPGRNGRDYLEPCLHSHRPLDLVIIMLGTNDLKARLARSASDVAESAARLAGIARKGPYGPGGAHAKVLLVAPPPLAQLTSLAEMFTGALEKSRRFGRLYPVFAAWHDVACFDAGSVARTSDIDGVHLEAIEHAKLGRALAAEARRLLEPR